MKKRNSNDFIITQIGLSVGFPLTYATTWGKLWYLGHLNVFIYNTGSTSLCLATDSVSKTPRREPIPEQALNISYYY